LPQWLGEPKVHAIMSDVGLIDCLQEGTAPCLPQTPSKISKKL
jgi:hypothetical protein